ncbi:MAG: TetR/AcrR family transcriptional regulator [Labedaea sp.]
MSVAARRQMIVHAVLPLLIEHGTAITTSQIARAAGIGEGTIFRAFKDKDELVDACTIEALRPDHALDAIADIPADLPLEERLVEAADALSAHLDRMGALMGALHASGRSRHRDGERRTAERGVQKAGRRESMVAIRAAMIELFEPDQDRLRLPAEQLASLLLALLFGGRRVPDGEIPGTRVLVGVFLHGVVEHV